MLRTSLKSLAMLTFSLSACDTAAPADSAQVALELASEQTYLIVYRLAIPPIGAELFVALNGGTLVASYPYGVVVAKSASSNFKTKMALNPLVESVAVTGGAAISAIPASIGYNPNKYLPAAPSPSSTPEQLAGMQWNMTAIKAAEARTVTRGKRSVVVGVLDSGIDDSVPDLVGQVDVLRSVTCVGGAPNGNPALWRNDWVGHGTHVSGIIAAKDDGRGVVGVAPGVSLAAINVVDDDALIFPEAFLCGLHWAATHNVQLVNASLILDPWYYYCPNDPTQSAITTAVQRAVKDAGNRGTTVVAAAGNESNDLANKTVDAYTGEPVSKSCKLLPVEADGVIGVSATGATSNLAFYSNYGFNIVDVAAPGGDNNVPAAGNPSGQILSTLPIDSYYYGAAIDWQGRVATGCPSGFNPNAENADASVCTATFGVLQGSSQATPHVTGVAALILSRASGSVSSSQLVQNFANSAREIACTSTPDATCTGNKSYNGFYGYGIVDAYKAVTN